jgi:hypothetical protein
MLAPLARSTGRVLIGASALLAGACATVSITYLDPRTFPPQEPESVVVLTERPRAAHLVIASLRLRTGGQEMSAASLTARLRREAAKLGGQAIVIYAQANAGVLVAPGPLVGSASTAREEQRSADVLVFTDGAPHPPAPVH